MSQTPLHSHSHRRRVARFYLIGIFLLLAGAVALLFNFAFHERDTGRYFIGLLFGYALASLLLLGGIWRRTGWSRYVLIGLNWLMLMIIALTASILGSRLEFGLQHAAVIFGPPTLLFVGANTWLIRSKRIRHLATPPGSGG